MIVDFFVVLGQAVFAILFLGIFAVLLFTLMQGCYRKDKEDFKQRALIETSQIPPLLMQDVGICGKNPRFCLKVTGKFRDETSYVLELRVPDECSQNHLRDGYVRVSQQVNDFVNIGEYVIVPATHCVIDNRRD